MDFNMKIESNTNQSTIISINKITHTTLSVLATLEYICWVIHATIDAKISNETQFETPFSVISSPIHIKRTDQTVITNADNNKVPKSVGITLQPRR